MSLCSVKTSSFMRRVVEDAVLGQDAPELGELGAVLGLQVLGLGDQGGQPGDLLAEHGRVDGDDLVFELGEELALLVLGQLVEVVGDAAFDLLPAVGFGVGQDLLAPVLHALQGAADGVDARGHPALEHGHREADGPAGGRVVGRGPDRLVLDVAGQRVVEVELLAVELEGRGLDLALGEELLDLARLRVGEGDQGFLGPPEIERGLARRMASSRLLMLP